LALFENAAQKQKDGSGASSSSPKKISPSHVKPKSNEKILPDIKPVENLSLDNTNIDNKPNNNNNDQNSNTNNDAKISANKPVSSGISARLAAINQSMNSTTNNDNNKDNTIENKKPPAKLGGGLNISMMGLKGGLPPSLLKKNKNNNNNKLHLDNQVKYHHLNLIVQLLQLKEDLNLIILVI